MHDFEILGKISDLLNIGKEETARNELIQYLENVDTPYPPLLNNLIRRVGLYPYLDIENSNWQEKFVYEVYKSDVGKNKLVTLHREQGYVLNTLLSGKNVILSAPTSFGKSFIIDALISIKQPKIIVILVPTIALMDEARRRLTNKFSDQYKIITTPEEDILEKSILIFPQERLFSYLGILKSIDLFIVDEFYKVSKDFDSERSNILLNAIMQAGKISKQKYYLCPNITKIEESPFTEDAIFISELNFNTVFSNVVNEYYDIVGTKEEKDKKKLKKIVKIVESVEKEKTLIYAGSYNAIDKIGNYLSNNIKRTPSLLIKNFSEWLKLNYLSDFNLIKYLDVNIGIHNGRLHRSLAQIQTKLFEDKDGLQFIISTSSLIEGVNTSAANVIMWQRKNGKSLLKYMDYKNLLGRSGRMFKHFVGNVYLLEKPIPEERIQLELEFSDDVQGNIDVEEYETYLDSKTIDSIQETQKKLAAIVGSKNLKKLLKENILQTSDWNVLISIANDMKNNPENWNCLKLLNSKNYEEWTSALRKILFTSKVFYSQGIDYNKIVNFIIVLAENISKDFNIQLKKMNSIGISVNDYFEFERKISFSLATIVHDINELQKILIPKLKCDISSFSSQLAFAFLKPNVFYLEEYGLPRMISKKIIDSGLVKIEDETKSLSEILLELKQKENDIYQIKKLISFDLTILKWFFEGIKCNN